MREPTSKGYCEFMPTLDEVYSRAEALRWMQLMEWPEYLIDDIMLRDSPEVEVVRLLVYRVGPDEAKRRLIFMNYG